MKQKKPEKGMFIPSDIQRIVTKMKSTWTKLTDRDIEYYLEGKRDEMINVLQQKCNFSSKEQAETTLNNIERLA